MSGIHVKQIVRKDGTVDITKMLQSLKFKMKVSKSLVEYIDSLEYQKPSDLKRKKRKQRHRTKNF